MKNNAKNSIRFIHAFRAICAVAVFALTAPCTADSGVDHFEAKIRPLLVSKCIECHGGKKAEAGLTLNSIETILAGGDSGPALQRGNARESLIVQAVRRSGDLEMPPDEALSEQEIEALVKWIEAGADWPSGQVIAGNGPQLRSGPVTDEERQFWSLQPIIDHAPPIIPEHAAEFQNWTRNAIDKFIVARLAVAELTPRSPAPKHVLLRRATFDLTGLPPTPEDIESFLSDRSPDAFEKVVDRLLDSRAYGERWGRHWLDVVRYADTAGETGDYPTPLSYKYRNWVINAFQADLPYDQFVREQIAGDILGEQLISKNGINDATLAKYNDMMLATGFIAISRRFGFDVENYHHLTIQDTIDTVGQAFLGLTLGCARCHDHKYDPVTTEDYYAWYGIFESTKYSFPGSEQKQRPYDTFPSVPPVLADELQAEFDKKLAAIDGEIKQLQTEHAELQKRLQAQFGREGFTGFETQAFGSAMTSDWGTLGNISIVKSAQSRFRNVFPRGSKGIALPGGETNHAFGRELKSSHTEVLTPKLYYNIDFQVGDDVAGATGTHRLYLGRDAGNSPAVEMAVGRNQFLVKNGNRYEPVLQLQTDEWYNVQVALDLRKKTFEGFVGNGVTSARIETRKFTDGWDGIINRTFVDRYGAGSGPLPNASFDNLSVKTQPFRHLTSSDDTDDDTEAIGVAWQEYIEDQRLTFAAKNRDNHSGFHVWHGNPLPVVGINVSDELLKVPGTIPAGKTSVHPGEKEGVGIVWRSPVSGKIRVTGSVMDAQDCGDSIEWAIDHLCRTGLIPMGKGANEPAGSQPFVDTRGEPLEFAVQQGDFVRLAILPKTNYGCDLTNIDLTIDLVDDARRWVLADDMADEPTSGNPHRDSFGNEETWYFTKVTPDRGRSAVQSQKTAKASLPISLETLSSLSKRLTALQSQHAGMRTDGPYDDVYGAMEGDSPADAQIRIRGNPKKLGNSVPRKNLEILGDDPLPSDSGSGRLAVANWLTRDSNPLLARVMVNRIWQLHFGRGLVGTENDFGTRGETPTHPELLDWLAARFMDGGWSVKNLHRLIMHSATYQQSSDFERIGVTKDPESRLLWRFQRRRLSAEEIRDAMLFISGDLDLKMGGPHPFPKEETWGFSQHAPYYGLYDTNKRSVYLMQQRLKRHPFLSLFDAADPNVPTARRELTTVPTQTLFLMNSDFVHGRSEELAKHVLSQTDDDRSRVQTLFMQILGRRANPEELESARRFLAEYEKRSSAASEKKSTEYAAWAALIRSLFVRNEFLFVD